MYTIKCNNCAGHGIIDKYKHIDNGICFKCSGSGVIQVSEQEYNDHIEYERIKNKGLYVLYSNGKIEHYKNKKDIHNRYGSFYVDDMKGMSIYTNYKNKHIHYTKINDDQDLKAFRDVCINNEVEQVQKKVYKYRKELENEKDREYIEMINAFIDKNENKIKKLQTNI